LYDNINNEIPFHVIIIPLIERREKTRCGEMTFCCMHEKGMMNKGCIKLSAENDPA
jgi:hypothetical protein